MRCRPTLLVLASSSAACSASTIRKRSTTDPSELSGKTFDFVIAGGGTAGLALAARLAEWTNITIAVIEAGTDGSEYEQQITVPGMSYLDGLTQTGYDWNYTTTTQTSAGNAVKTWPRGKGLGGSSAINGGFWCRGSSAEYDAWNTLQNGASGAEDWGWDSMQAAIKKAETFTPMTDDQAATFSVTHDSDAHGTSGPIQASFSSYQYSHLETWVPTMMAMGLPHLLDPANGTNVGVSFTPSIINPANGSRSDSNFGYIAPYSGTNLVILTGYQVTKVIWSSTTEGAAVAGGLSFAASASGTVYTVHAAKEVILSGGTIGSPQILQLSGVGPKTLVTGKGIKSVVDLPGVGANLQDHLSASLYMQATDNNTWAALKFDQTLWNEQLDIWRTNGTGMWTYWNEAIAYPAIADLMGSNASTWVAGLDMSSALTSSVSASSMDDTVAAGVKAQYAILSEWAASTSIGQVELIFNMFGSAASMISIQFCIQHPFSRGTIQITSDSVFDYPAINPNYLNIGYDLDIMRAALKYTRNIIGTAPMSSMIVSETEPGSATTADADLDSYIGSWSTTEYHPIGTNSMLPLESGGVVNTSLIVYGTTNLRVVDVSVAPLHISAHTMATAYGIAERAADLIKATYGAVVTSTNGSTSDSGGNNSGSSSSSSSSNSGTTTKSASNLSTGAKAAIGAGSAVAAIAVIAILMLVRRRANNKRNAAAATHAGLGGKDDAWYADDLPMQPARAPFMNDSRRQSAQPSEISMDTYAASEGAMKYDQQEYGQQQHYEPTAEGEYAHAPMSPSQYGATHASLSTGDVAALHPSYPPGSPGPMYPHSPQGAYIPQQHDAYGYGQPHDMYRAHSPGA